MRMIRLALMDGREIYVNSAHVLEVAKFADGETAVSVLAPSLNTKDGEPGYAFYQVQGMVHDVAADITRQANRGEFAMPQECLEHECDYYLNYLAYGPAHLTHEGFHAGARQYTAHMNHCRKSAMTGICPTCKDWEVRLRH